MGTNLLECWHQRVQLLTRRLQCSLMSTSASNAGSVFIAHGARQDEAEGEVEEQTVPSR